MVDISFCVPTYNRQESVTRCIKSLLNQSAPNDSYEIIVVDDHSTDHTVQIIQELFDTAEFTQGKIITLEENTGNASIPRNIAAENAQGEYLFFVDSDDFVDASLVENLYPFAQANDADIVYPKYKSETGNRSVPQFFSRDGSKNTADVVHDQLMYGLSVLKAFKRSEWERLNIKFDPNISVGEDMLAVSKFLFNTNKASILADRDYYIISDIDDIGLSGSDQNYLQEIKNYGDILDLILAGSRKDEKTKQEAAGRFINRINTNGVGANNRFLSPQNINSEQSQELIRLYSELYSNHLPQKVEHYIRELYRPKVLALKAADAACAQQAAWEQHEKQKNNVEQPLRSAANGGRKN